MQCQDNGVHGDFCLHANPLMIDQAALLQMSQADLHQVGAL